MTRAVAPLLVGLALSACAKSAPTQAAPAAAPCADMPVATGELTPGECQLEVSGRVVRFTFAPVAEGAVAGNVSAEVIDEDGAVVQTLLEPDVSEYLPPSAEDVDGDGRADILIRRESGNVNTVSGVWIYSGERGAYQRAGEVSGVEIQRTSEGYIAVPARSGAAAWNVAFYRLDEGGLIPLVTVGVEAQDVSADGRVTRSDCTLTDAPGLADLNLTLEAAQAKFCAEPAAGVFGP